MMKGNQPSSNPKRLAWSDQHAREALCRYEPAVHRCANELRGVLRFTSALDREDLVAEGRVAVLEALQNFHYLGTSEENWVLTRVRQRMRDAIRRMSFHSRTAVRKDRDLKRDTDELAHSAPLAFGIVFCDNIERHPSMSPTPYDMAHAHAQRQRVRYAVKQLPEQQRMALRLKIREDLSLSEIGLRMGISPSRVCQLHRHALETLHNRLSKRHVAQAA